MDYRRVIPCLDVKDGRLVKGVHFVQLRDVGDPADAAEAYSRAGADELVLLDIGATVEARATMLDVVRRIVARVNVPMTVGGGVASIDDMRRLFDLGVTNVAINTAAVHDHRLIKIAAKEFGSQRITVAIDARRSKELPGGYEVMVCGGQKATGLDVVEWAKQAAALGAGTILPTSMNADGALTGYDIALTRAIADAANVPVIASGGAGRLEHLSEAILEGHADAVLVASIAHFGTFTIRQMKEHLVSRGIPVKL